MGLSGADDIGLKALRELGSEKTLKKHPHKMKAPKICKDTKNDV
jgi:hypothetical protein